MLKRSISLPATIAAALLSFSAHAADITAVGSATVVKADGSYVVTETLAPR